MFDIADRLAEVRNGWMLSFYGIIDMAFTVSVILGPVLGSLIAKKRNATKAGSQG